MGFKTLELTLISAKDLKDVNLIGKMDPYVVVYLSDSPSTKQKTPVHQDAGTNPSWNYTVRFNVDENAAASLIFKIKHDQLFGADKDLGEVTVPLKELFDGFKGKDSSTSQFLAYQVKRSSGRAQGEFKFSYKILDSGKGQGKGQSPSPDPYSAYGQPVKHSQSSPGSSSYASAPPMGYPAAAAQPYPPHQPGGYPYPPPQQAAGGVYPPPAAQYGAYPPPPAAGVPYGAPAYPPQQPGYGYPPPPQGGGYEYPPQGGYPPAGYGGYPPQMQNAQKPKKKKNGNFGMGLGAGLLGGVVGGLLLGEVVDDVYDAGYDDGGGGFDDGGGFDF